MKRALAGGLLAAGIVEIVIAALVLVALAVMAMLAPSVHRVDPVQAALFTALFGGLAGLGSILRGLVALASPERRARGGALLVSAAVLLVVNAGLLVATLTVIGRAADV